MHAPRTALAALTLALSTLTGCAIWESAAAGETEVVDPERYTLTFETCNNPGEGETLNYEATLTNLTDEDKRWELQVTMVDTQGTERLFANSIALPLDLNESDATLSSRSGSSDLVGAVECIGVVLEDPLSN